MQLQPYQPGTMRRDGEAVVAGQRRAVHADREDGLLQLLAREDPARAGDRRPPGSRVVVDAGDEDARRAGGRADAIEDGLERNAFPVRRAHQAVVGLVGVARAFHQHAPVRADVGFEIAESDVRGRGDATADLSVQASVGGRFDGAAVRTKNCPSRCGMRRARCEIARAADRSVKSRASRPSPSRRPNGGARSAAGVARTARCRRNARWRSAARTPAGGEPRRGSRGAW